MATIFGRCENSFTIIRIHISVMISYVPVPGFILKCDSDEEKAYSLKHRCGFAANVNLLTIKGKVRFPEYGSQCPW